LDTELQRDDRIIFFNSAAAKGVPGTWL
jgi:hypothetical protein